MFATAPFSILCLHGQTPILKSINQNAPGSLADIETSVITQNTGNIGIGTNNPGQLLTVKRLAYFAPLGGTSILDTRIRLEYDETPTNHIWDMVNANNGLSFYYRNNDFTPLKMNTAVVDINTRLSANYPAGFSQKNSILIESKLNERRISWTDSDGSTSQQDLEIAYCENPIAQNPTYKHLMRFLPNQQVQIGKEHNIYKNYTGDPQQPDNNMRLTVDGGIAAKRYVATLQNWADWVFDDPSKKPSLDAEWESIVKNRTLVGVPSASQVVNGRDLAENDALLLSKIEQNYLHDIEQKDEIEKLKAEIVLLKQQLAALLSKTK